MDTASLGLIESLLEDRITTIRKALPRVESGRGQKLVELVDALVGGVELERDAVLEALSTASDPEEGRVHARKLLRLLTQVRGFSLLTPYLNDIGRVDLQMGLVQAIEVLIESLLPDGADPIVHLDEHHMYSTLDLISLTEPVRSALGISATPELTPVVFFLPGTDPNNALLLPLLAHEVGHAAVDQANLVTEVLGRSDADSLNKLLDECMTVASISDATSWQIQLFRWLEELLCDAMATVLTGPSFLYASAVFFPAPDVAVLGSHPFPSDRVGATLRLLVSLGWGEVLDSTPQITNWLGGITQEVRDPGQEQFLRGAIQIIEPALFEVARSHVRGSLDPGEFDGVRSFLAELLQVGVPPAEIGGEPVPPWAAVLAAWLHYVHQHGDTSVSLVEAVADTAFNESTLKSIEMSRILDLWRSA